MTWQQRFDRLLKAMVQGEPHKAAKRVEEDAAARRHEEETKRAP